VAEPEKGKTKLPTLNKFRLEVNVYEKTTLMPNILNAIQSL